ncbi:MAG: YggT family protein [Proteobacteria bacterium]|nr:YggT family protein [Pseudomonadota bacterium]
MLHRLTRVCTHCVSRRRGRLLFSIFNLILYAVAGLLVNVLLLRFWMQAVRVRPPMSVAEFTFQLTDWLVKPLRRVIPGVAGYDWASLIGALLVTVVATLIGLQVWSGIAPDDVLVQSLLRLIQWAIYGLMFALVLEVIFSWVNPYAPLAPFVRTLNEPILRPLRRIIPLVGNVDLSVFVAFILLQIALTLVARFLFPGA